MKNVSVFALVMIVLIVPAVALSENADGSPYLDNGDVSVTREFDDRTAGEITVTVHNANATPMSNVKVYAKDPLSGRTYDTKTTDVAAGGSAVVRLSFTVDTPGTYWATVFVENSTGTIIDQMTVSFTVGQSIWSNTMTYVAIVAVIIILIIVAFIKIRSAPKVDNAGAYTAHEEERKAGKKKSGTGKEEYKGRSKKE